MKSSLLHLLVFLFISNENSSAQIWNLAGPWEVNCGIQAVEGGTVRCAICLPFEINKVQNQFEMVFAGNKIFVNDDNANPKFHFDYTYDTVLKILKFKYNERDYSFKVLPTGKNFILAEENTDVVLLLKRREGYIPKLSPERK